MKITLSILLLICYFAMPALTLTLDEIRVRVMFAYAAYCNFDSGGLSNYSCFWCQNTPMVEDTLPVYGNSSDIFAYLGVVDLENTRTLLVSFRGTELTSLLNWLKDVEAWHMAPYKGHPLFLVHDGFYTAYSLMNASLYSSAFELFNLHPDIEQILFTGHSLGAALAGFAALDFAENFVVKEISLLNFGMPRIGNQPFSKYFSQMVPNSFRVVNQRDLVPHLPVESMGYYHIPTEVWFQNNTSVFRICKSKGEDPSCSDSEFDYSIEDHLDYLGYWEPTGKAHNC